MEPRGPGMNRFAKIMQFLGWLGIAVLAVVWAQGFVVRGDTPALARHSTIALAAASLCVLPRFWTMAFLVLAARGRARLRGRGSKDDTTGGARSATRIRRRALVASGVALVALSGSFALAGAILMRRASPVAHAIAGFVAIAFQVAALLLERRALLADAGEMQELGRSVERPGSAPAESGPAAGRPVSGAS